MEKEVKKRLVVEIPAYIHEHWEKQAKVLGLPVSTFIKIKLIEKAEKGEKW